MKNQLPSRYSFYEDFLKIRADFKLRDKIIVCDYGAKTLLKGLFLKDFNIQIKTENKIIEQINLMGDKICWLSYGTSLTGSPPFYVKNKMFIRKINYILIIKGNFLNGMYYGLSLYKKRGDSFKLVRKIET